MLTGIKVGKKKIKAVVSEQPHDSERMSTTAPPNDMGRSNTLAADQLRELLQQPQSSRISSSKPLCTWKEHSDERVNSFRDVVLITQDVSRVPVSTKEEADMTVLELLKQEKSSQYDFAKQEMKSILNQKKKRGRSHNLGDDDDEWQTHLYSSTEGNDDGTRGLKEASSSKRSTPLHPNHRFRDDKKIVTSHCPWWIQSSNFSSHRLITTNYLSVTTSMAPPSSSLTFGEHFYICPIDYTPSLTACDDNVWQEIRAVQSMLRAIARQENKGVVFFETVLESSSRSKVWQTRLEAVFVPMATYLDASLYFRSALQELADENSTYTKLIATNASKTVRTSVPKQFPYFYVEYDDSPRGYILMIESSKFPKDFGMDTIASMLHIDPIRFRSHNKQLSQQEDGHVISSFMRKYETILSQNEEK
jgi:Protein similar to CwfJ C-terminus 2/Protein similar to CwfJ C-terminus 1